MAVTVLIVDDSSFFRRRLSDMITGVDGLSVVGCAENGLEAVELCKKLKPDVITMDYEMPVMDGITAVRRIMQECPTPILMFSSLTYEGARITLDSLAAGAVDYLPKNFSEIASNSAQLKKRLAQCILDVAAAGKKSTAPTTPFSIGVRPASTAAASSVSSATSAALNLARHSVDCNVIVIGTSTGGPLALQNVLSSLPANFSKPLVLVQHMPAAFTKAFAERLNSFCQITVKEAVDGDRLAAGVALLAPGGKQLIISAGGTVKVLPGDERLHYKPCVDITFASAANVFADKVLAVVLTGMGADGCEGAKLLKQKGATVWGQDERTSVIYGMPMAVAKAQLTDEVLPLEQIGPRLIQATL
ncbi:chemotaxis response regulator protein-glutamate methylesterase [Dasania sp. GY-MA-18]|uniref:Protein-glutamate methylesterase/protein-glutamine glutaminase n=1 Tax=Dasania phycosphaerae TaxID=2950436 RepID=A0A9J6RI25_9GAMM|nr:MULTISPECIES: chemotaxis response regulator protein-glutamate methylesterase [Dasania]MCR8921679.1 chemotaxis response regulator protein-glutamate methylesterase [Dasania sp. GY-MA-18]MCZ0864107.1 chemotaxis response regulator protein-glutamate methylesterase [Dasania phycosphaerae]MCZ0867835.1 chemotaxis response regulator protein-glutamate methylesterase [Dasania phycosphaerae]